MLGFDRLSHLSLELLRYQSGNGTLNKRRNFFCDDQPKHSCKPILRLGAHETRTRTLYMSQ